jgi:hypothetical protein
MKDPAEAWAGEIPQLVPGEPFSPQTKARLEHMLEQMRFTANEFYSSAVRIGQHTFIEFNGMLLEYIKGCQNMYLAEVDFTMNNQRPTEEELHYIGEKFECIWGHCMTDPRLRTAFVAGVLGAQLPVVYDKVIQLELVDEEPPSEEEWYSASG